MCNIWLPETHARETGLVYEAERDYEELVQSSLKAAWPAKQRGIFLRPAIVEMRNPWSITMAWVSIMNEPPPEYPPPPLRINERGKGGMGAVGASGSEAS